MGAFAVGLAEELRDSVFGDDGVGEGGGDVLAVDSRLVDVEVIDWTPKGSEGLVKGT